MKKVTYLKALNDAFHEEMRRDDKIIVFGEDVAVDGGVFCVTKGLYEEFGPDRVMDTPVSESAIVGGGLGAALAGQRPVVEVMYTDFLLCAFNEVFHNVAKWRYLNGGQFEVPLVIRCAEGHSLGAGAEHSNCFASLLMHAPGLKIALPSNAYDAKGLLKTAIRENNPVIFLEHKQLYQQKGEVPDEEYTVPFGQAKICREGSDVTIVALSFMVGRAMEAAEQLHSMNIEAEVIDPRTVAPLDMDTICESVKKTKRLVVLEEGNLTCGVGAEIASRVQAEVFDYLDAPIARIAALDVPLPYNLTLEAYAIPQTHQVVEAVQAML